MIEVTRLQGQKIVINANLIEFVEETPDTMVTLTTGKKIMVRETVAEVIDLATRYQASVLRISRKKSG